MLIFSRSWGNGGEELGRSTTKNNKLTQKLDQMKYCQIGNRVINLETLSHAYYEPESSYPGLDVTWPECVLTFGSDVQIFYGDEATQAWEILTTHAIMVAPLGVKQRQRYEINSEN